MMPTALTTTIADHPRLLGAVFTVLVFLSTSGAAAACRKSFIVGP